MAKTNVGNMYKDDAGTVDPGPVENPTWGEIEGNIDAQVDLMAIFTSLDLDVQARILISAIGAANGVAPLGSDGQVPNAFIGPAVQYGFAASSDLDNTFAIAMAAIPSSQKAAPNGVATLNGSGQIPDAQIPAIAVTDYLGSVANQAAMLGTAGQKGDWLIRTDLGTTWVITGSNPTVIGSWTQLQYPTSPVSSVAGRTGPITLTQADIASLVPDLADKASLAQLALKANSTDVNAGLALKATQTDVTAALALKADASALAGKADQSALDSQASAVTTALGQKAPLTSPVFLGDPKAPTPPVTDNDTSIATTAFVQAAAKLAVPTPTDIEAYQNAIGLYNFDAAETIPTLPAGSIILQRTV